MDRTIVLRFDARLLIVLGALLVIAGVGLPWANLPSFIAGGLARNGLSAGGLFSLGFAVLALVGLLVPWHPFRRVSVLAVIFALLIELVALLALIQTVQMTAMLHLDLAGQLGSLGLGLVLTFAGVILVLAGGLSGVPAPSTLGPVSLASLRNQRRLEWALGLGLVFLLALSCICAWTAGLLIGPVTGVTVAQVSPSPTFGSAPSQYLTTPLVGVQLAPLGTVGVGATRATTSLPTATRPLVATATLPPITPLPTVPPPKGDVPPAGATPTLFPTATRPPLPSPTPLPRPTDTPAIPVFPTATPFISPLPTPSQTNTPTPVLTPTLTPTATITTTATVTPLGTAGTEEP